MSRITVPAGDEGGRTRSHARLPRCPLLPAWLSSELAFPSAASCSLTQCTPCGTNGNRVVEGVGSRAEGTGQGLSQPGFLLGVARRKSPRGLALGPRHGGQCAGRLRLRAPVGTVSGRVQTAFPVVRTAAHSCRVPGAVSAPRCWPGGGGHVCVRARSPSLSFRGVSCWGVSPAPPLPAHLVLTALCL